MASLAEDSTQAQTQQPSKPNNAYFPKRGQILELVCESLGFKGKGVCKVEDSGFIVMCDRALPGERFIGRVTRKKGNYAEVLLLLFGTLEHRKWRIGFGSRSKFKLVNLNIWVFFFWEAKLKMEEFF